MWTQSNRRYLQLMRDEDRRHRRRCTTYDYSLCSAPALSRSGASSTNRPSSTLVGYGTTKSLLPSHPPFACAAYADRSLSVGAAEVGEAAVSAREPVTHTRTAAAGRCDPARALKLSPAQLHTITSVSLTRRHITALHTNFLHLEHMHTLNLAHNALRTVHHLLPPCPSVHMSHTNNGDYSSSSSDVSSCASGECASARCCRLTAPAGCRRLCYLTLSNNRLTDLAQTDVPRLLSLRELNLAHNRLRNVRGTVSQLRRLRNLTKLDMRGNPLCRETDYRLCVLSQMPQLDMLDGVRVNRHETAAYAEAADEDNAIDNTVCNGNVHACAKPPFSSASHKACALATSTATTSAAVVVEKTSCSASRRMPTCSPPTTQSPSTTIVSSSSHGTTHKELMTQAPTTSSTPVCGQSNAFHAIWVLHQPSMPLCAQAVKQLRRSSWARERLQRTSGSVESMTHVTSHLDSDNDDEPVASTSRRLPASASASVQPSVDEKSRHAAQTRRPPPLTEQQNLSSPTRVQSGTNFPQSRSRMQHITSATETVTPTRRRASMHTPTAALPECSPSPVISLTRAASQTLQHAASSSSTTSLPLSLSLLPHARREADTNANTNTAKQVMVGELGPAIQAAAELVESLSGAMQSLPLTTPSSPVRLSREQRDRLRVIERHAGAMIPMPWRCAEGEKEEGGMLDRMGATSSSRSNRKSCMCVAEGDGNRRDVPKSDTLTKERRVGVSASLSKEGLHMRGSLGMSTHRARTNGQARKQHENKPDEPNQYSVMCSMHGNDDDDDSGGGGDASQYGRARTQALQHYLLDQLACFFTRDELTALTRRYGESEVVTLALRRMSPSHGTPECADAVKRTASRVVAPHNTPHSAQTRQTEASHLHGTHRWGGQSSDAIPPPSRAHRVGAANMTNGTNNTASLKHSEEGYYMTTPAANALVHALSAASANAADTDTLPARARERRHDRTLPSSHRPHTQSACLTGRAKDSYDTWTALSRLHDGSLLSALLTPAQSSSPSLSHNAAGRGRDVCRTSLSRSSLQRSSQICETDGNGSVHAQRKALVSPTRMSLLVRESTARPSIPHTRHTSFHVTAHSTPNSELNVNSREKDEDECSERAKKTRTCKVSLTEAQGLPLGECGANATHSNRFMTATRWWRASRLCETGQAAMANANSAHSARNSVDTAYCVYNTSWAAAVEQNSVRVARVGPYSCARLREVLSLLRQQDSAAVTMEELLRGMCQMHEVTSPHSVDTAEEEEGEAGGGGTSASSSSSSSEASQEDENEEEVQREKEKAVWRRREPRRSVSVSSRAPTWLAAKRASSGRADSDMLPPYEGGTQGTSMNATLIVGEAARNNAGTHRLAHTCSDARTTRDTTRRYRTSSAVIPQLSVENVLCALLCYLPFVQSRVAYFERQCVHHVTEHSRHAIVTSSSSLAAVAAEAAPSRAAAKAKPPSQSSRSTTTPMRSGVHASDEIEAGGGDALEKEDEDRVYFRRWKAAEEHRCRLVDALERTAWDGHPIAARMLMNPVQLIMAPHGRHGCAQ